MSTSPPVYVNCQSRCAEKASHLVRVEVRVREG